MGEVFDRIKAQVNSPAQSYDATMEEPEQMSMADRIARQRSVESNTAFQLPGFQKEKYTPYLGETFNPLSDIDEQRAQSQTGLQLTGNFFGQLATEAILGMPEAIGYGLDFENLTNREEQRQEGFDNEFSKFFKEAKNQVQEEYFPVYQTKRAQEGNFGERLTDGTFWASQGKTIGTTLALMLPSLALSVAGTAVAGPLVGAVLAAGFSRKAESAMEAQQVFEQEYDKYIKAGKDDAEARQLAGKAAASTFNLNAAMLPLDFVQFAVLTRAGKAVKGIIDSAKKTKIGTVANALFQPASEAMEEGYQFVASQESINAARTGTGVFGEGFGDRFEEYITDPEFQTSMLMGAVTGTVFDVGGHLINKAFNKNKETAEIKNELAKEGNYEAIQKLDNSEASKMLIKSYNTDKLDSFVQEKDEYLEGLRKSDKVSPEDLKYTEDVVKGLKEDVSFIKTLDEKVQSDMPELATTPYTRKLFVLNQYQAKKNDEYVNKLTNTISELENKENKDKRDYAVEANAKLGALELYKNKLIKDNTIEAKDKVPHLKQIETKIEAAKVERDTRINEAKQDFPEFSLENYSLPYTKQYKEALSELEVAKTKKGIIAAKTATVANLYNETVTPEQRIAKLNTWEKAYKQKAEGKLKDEANTAIVNNLQAAPTANEAAQVINSIPDKNTQKKVIAKVAKVAETEPAPESYLGNKKEVTTPIKVKKTVLVNNTEEVEAKKADIERRREEELNLLLPDRKENLRLLKLSKKYGSTFGEIQDFLHKRGEKTWTQEDRDIYYLNEKYSLNNAKEDWDIPIDEIINEEQASIDKYLSSKRGDNVPSKINAKYDAEIDALEQQFTTSNKSVIEAKKLAIEKRKQEELKQLRYSDLFKSWKSGDERTTEQNIAENEIYTKYKNLEQDFTEEIEEEDFITTTEYNLASYPTESKNKQIIENTEFKNTLEKALSKFKGDASVSSILGSLANEFESENINVALDNLRSISSEIRNIVNDVTEAHVKGKEKWHTENGEKPFNEDLESFTDSSLPVVSDTKEEDEIITPKDERIKANLMEYKIEVGGNTDYGKQPWKETAKNDDNYELDPINKKDYDPAYINNPSKDKELELELEVEFGDANLERWQGGNYDKVQIVGVVYDSKGRHVMTMLSNDAKLKDIRKEIIDGALKAEKGKIYKSGYKVKAEKGWGRIKRTKDKIGISTIKSNNLPNGKVVLGVVREKDKIRYIDSGGVTGFPSRDLFKQSRLGATLMWIKGSNGVPIPVRTFTKNFQKIKKELPDVYKQELEAIRNLFDSITPENIHEKLSVLKSEFFDAKYTISQKNGKATHVTFTKKFLAASMEQYKKARTNKDEATEKEIVESLQDKYKYTEAEALAILSGRVSVRSAEASTKNVAIRIELGNKNPKQTMSVHSDNFEMFLADMEHQVDVAQINTSTEGILGRDYNKYVSQFLVANVPEDNITHSPVFHLQTLPYKEDVKVDEVKPTESSTTKVEETPVIESEAPASTLSNINQSSLTNEDVTTAQKKLSRKKKSTEKPREVEEDNEFKKINLEKELGWLTERFPIGKELLVDITDTLLNIGGRNAWGSFKGNLIKVYRNALEGTVYHEGFHAVFNMALSRAKQTEVLQEAAKLYGDKGVKDLEEILAEKFTEFVQSLQYSGKSFTGKIKAFFNNINAFVKYNLLHSNSVDMLFYSINSGEFKHATFTYSKAGTAPRIVGTNYVEENNRVRAMSSIMSDTIDKFLLKKYNQNSTRVDIINKYGLSQILKLAFDTVYDKYYSISEEDLTDYQDSQYSIMLANVAPIVETEERTTIDSNTATNNLGELGRLVLTDFAANENLTLNIANNYLAVGEDKITDEDIKEMAEDTNRLEHWMISAVEQSRRDKLGSELKSYLSRIKAKDETGETITDDLGFDTYLDRNEAFATLLRELSDVTGSDELVEELKEIAGRLPKYKDVYEDVVNNHNLKTKFWIAFQNSHVDFLHILQQDINRKERRNNKKVPVNMHYTVRSSNRQKITTVIIDSWKEGIINPITSVVAKYKSQYLTTPEEIANPMSNSSFAKQAQELVERIKKFYEKNAYKTNLKAFANLINTFGIDVTEEELKMMDEHLYQSGRGQTQSDLEYFAIKLKPLLFSISRGEILGNDTSHDQIMKDPARKIGQIRADLMEDSFKNGENKTVYSHILMSFQAKLMSLLKNKNNFDEAGDVKADSFLAGLRNTIGYKRTSWLKDLKREEIRDEFEFTLFDSLRMSEDNETYMYSGLGVTKLNVSRVNMFINNMNKKFAYYMDPILSDTPTNAYVKAPRKSNKDVVTDLTEMLLDEWELAENAADARGVKDLEGNLSKHKLVIFAELNKVTKKTGEKSVKDLLEEFNDSATIDSEKINIYKQLQSKVEEYLDGMVTSTITEFEAQQIITKDKDNKLQSNQISTKAFEAVQGGEFTLASYPDINSLMKNYVYNTALAKANMLVLFTGNPASYANTETLYKRLKEIWSPGTRLDAKAKYTLSPEQAKEEGVTSQDVFVGDEYTAITIQDVKEVSNIAEEILALHKDKGDEAYFIAAAFGYYNGEFKGQKAAFPLNEDGSKKDYCFLTDNNNISDGSTFISPRRARTVKIGLGKWNNELQENFLKLLKGKPADAITNPNKPFIFGFKQKGNLRIPYQIKNSEVMLDPSVIFLKTVDGITENVLPTKEDRDNGYKNYTAPTLAKILDKMERYSYGDSNYVGVAHFNSVFKVGEEGVVKIEDIDNAPVLKFANDDYMIISEVPTHHMDDKSNFGVQIRKLIIADLADIVYNVTGIGNKTKDEVIQLYQDIIETDVKDEFDKVEELFPSENATVEEYNAKIEKLSQRLINEAHGRNMGSQALWGLSLNRDNADGRYRFNIPLFDPIHAKRTEALLASFYKNSVIKQKINGGNLVMASSVGYSDKLQIILSPNKKSVVGIQAKLPYWSKELFQDYFIPGTNRIDMNRIKAEAPELLKVIGYRIPTEDKYSMLPIIVEEFLPQSSGNIIILPREITTIMGADFDIDKLYMMFPNFKKTFLKEGLLVKDIKEYAKKNKEEFEGVDLSTSNIEIVVGQIAGEQILNEEDLPIYDFYEKNKDKYGKTAIQKINFDSSIPLNEQSKKARDNAKIDIMWSILTSEGTTNKLLNRGNFEFLSILANRIKLKKGYEKNLDVLNPSTDTKMYEAAMGASALIGVFANHNVNHAILQHGDIRLDKPVSFGGKEYDSLSQVKGDDIESFDNIDAGKNVEDNSPTDDNKIKSAEGLQPELTSRKLSMMLSAIVDDLKHLNSGPLNINFFTADILCGMMRLGMNMSTSLAFINQPIIIRLKELNDRYGNNNEGYKRALAAVKKELSDFKSKGLTEEELMTMDLQRAKTNVDEVEVVSKLTDADLTFTNLWNEIGKKDYNKDLQLIVLDKFDQLRTLGFDLGKLIKAFKSDDVKRKTTLASNEVYINNVEEVFEDKKFKGLPELWNKMNMMKAFYNYGIKGSSKTLTKFFMYNNPAFLSLKKKINKNLAGNKKLSESQIEYLNFEFMSAAISGFEFFNPALEMTISVDNNPVSITQEEYFITKFPNYYTRALQHLNKVAPGVSKQFRILTNISPLSSDELSSTRIHKLKFRNTGTLTDRDKAQISSSWAGLLDFTHSDKNIQDLVRNLGEKLIKYTYFAYGFHMDSDSFSQYIPFEWRTGLTSSDGKTSYNQFLEQLFESSKIISNFDNLYKQFKQNNYKNSFFVQKLNKDEEGIKKMIEKGRITIKDNVPVSVKVNATSEDDLLIKERTNQNGKQGVFPDFITADINGKTYLYELILSENIEDNLRFFSSSADYVLTNTLGKKMYHKEYNINVSDKKSIHTDNNSGVGTTNIDSIAKPVQETPVPQQPATTNKFAGTQEMMNDVSNEEFSAVNDIPSDLIGFTSEERDILVDNAKEAFEKDFFKEFPEYNVKREKDINKLSDEDLSEVISKFCQSK